MYKLMSFFLLLYLLVFPFGQLARLPLYFFGPEVRVYWGDVLVGLMVGIWGIWKVKRVKKGKKEKRGNKGLTKAILAFAGAAVLSLLVNIPRLAPGETLVASFYLLRWIIYAGLYFVVSDVKKLKTKNEERKSTAKNLKPLDLLVLVGGITAAFGLLQYLYFPDLRVWLEAGHWDPHYYRVYGTFFDPGFFGMIMVLALILVVIRLFDRNSPSKFILYTLYPILYTSLVLTYSRASYLAFLVGMGIIAWKLKKPKFYGAVLGIFLITILLLPRPGGEGVKLEREESIKARIINWKQSLTIAKDHPIFGVGFNAYRYAQRDYGFLKENWQFSHAGAGADSSLLFILATTGIVGLTAYLLLFKRILHTAYYIPHTPGSLAVFASLSALLVHSFFLNSLFYPWIMAWMWILLASI